MLKGRVVSNKSAKTASVLVESRKTHPVYKKSFVHSTKYLVDDQIGVNIGDIVEFEKVRPISKRKHWRITKVVGRDIIATETQNLKSEAKEAIEEVLPEAKPEMVEAEAEAVVEVAAEEAPKAKKAKKGAAKK